MDSETKGVVGSGLGQEHTSSRTSFSSTGESAMTSSYISTGTYRSNQQVTGAAHSITYGNAQPMRVEIESENEESTQTTVSTNE